MKVLYCILAIVLLLASCSSAMPDSEQVTLSTRFPVPTTPLRPTYTAQWQKNDPVASPTRAPTPAQTRTESPHSAIDELGVIWLRRWGITNTYPFYDLSTRRMEELQAPRDCADLIPGTMQSLCPDATGNFSLWIPGSDQQEPLPIPADMTVQWTPNGKYLYYWDMERGKIERLDLQTRITETLASALSDTYTLSWLGAPALSSDGEHLVGSQTIKPWETRLFEIERGPHSMRELVNAQPQATSDLAWSPTAPRFVYGVTNVKTEFCCVITAVYLYEIESRSNHLLAEGVTFEQFFHSEIWSPDGKKIAAIRGRDMCIIEVDSARQQCYQIAKGDGAVAVYTWSPKGRYIAYVDQAAKELKVLSVATGEVIVLSSKSVMADALDWR